MAEKKRTKGGIILEVAILFALAMISTGILTYITQHARADTNIKMAAEQHSEEIADEVALSVREFPAFRWLLTYWYENYETLDIEYDTEFVEGTKTEEKYRVFLSHNPDVRIKYVDTAQISKFSEEDRKLYAEICYSWLLMRVNQIKQTYGLDFLFCVLTEDPFTEQFFIFSGADPGAVRGTNYEEVYPLGHKVTVDENLQLAMRNASQFSSHLADAGSYVDYYYFLAHLGNGKTALIGVTYNLAEMQEEIRQQTIRETAFAVFHLFLLFLLCMALISHFVLRPLKNVQQNIRLYKNTKDSKDVIANLKKVSPNNEIGELSQDVVDLTQALDKHIEELKTITAERERITAELSLATRLQEAFIPHTFPAFPDRTEFDLYASMDPAREVGGDFYDFFLIDDDHLCVVIADVAGKGIPAALFMMVSKIIVKNSAMLGKSAAEILTRTNQAICDNNQAEMFVTVWLGILEISTGILTAANAGHECPVIKQPDGSFEIFKTKHGLVIGGYDSVKYHEYSIQLEPGTKLFVYTDGLPEAADSENNMFGMDRVLEALNKNADAAPQQLLDSVRHSVDEFVQDAEQFDDLTMLCLEYKGKNTAE